MCLGATESITLARQLLEPIDGEHDVQVEPERRPVEVRAPVTEHEVPTLPVDDAVSGVTHCESVVVEGMDGSRRDDGDRGILQTRRRGPRCRLEFGYRIRVTEVAHHLVTGQEATSRGRVAETLASGS